MQISIFICKSGIHISKEMLYSHLYTQFSYLICKCSYMIYTWEDKLSIYLHNKYLDVQFNVQFIIRPRGLLVILTKFYFFSCYFGSI